MAIARSVRPTVLVLGIVVRTQVRNRKSDNAAYADEVILAQDSGAQVAVTIYRRDGNPGTTLPTIGEQWSCEASVEESRDYGASLAFERTAERALDSLLASTR